MLNQDQALPSFAPCGTGLLQYPWPGAQCDFGYPLEVSSSLYRVADLLPLLQQLPFRNPNTLEAELAARAGLFAASQPILLCPPVSLTFCAPINKVQTVFQNNRSGQKSGCSAETLAELFGQGHRLDVSHYRHKTPQACHEEVELKLLPPAATPSGDLNDLLTHAQYAWQQGRLADAAALLTQARRLEPGALEITVALGSLLFQREDSAGAYEQFLEVTQRTPNDPLAQVRLASAALRLGLTKVFENAMARALEIDPHNGEALQFLGNLHLNRGEFKEAAQLFNRLLQVTPNSIEILLSLAVCFGRTGDGETARLLYERVLSLDPRNALAVENLSVLTGTPRPAPAPATPLVSIIIPCYKQAQLLTEAVESVLAQTCGAWEIIIVNFGAQTGFWITGDWNPARLREINLLNYCSLYRREIWEQVGG